MTCLTLGDVAAMKGNISPLFKNATTDTSALKFDALVLKSQLALVDETVNSTSSERKIMDIAGYLQREESLHSASDGQDGCASEQGAVRSFLGI